jgi:hypothetical protein
MTLAPAEPRTFREQAGAKPTPEGGLLSREATAAVGSAFNTLTETVKKHEQSLEDVVRETLQVMAGRKFAPRRRADGAGRSRTDHSRTLTAILAELASVALSRSEGRFVKLPRGSKAEADNATLIERVELALPEGRPCRSATLPEDVVENIIALNGTAPEA